MWYFAWLLGLPFAAAFAVLNAMWYELVDDDKSRINIENSDAHSSGLREKDRYLL